MALPNNSARANPPTMVNPVGAICGLQPLAHEFHHSAERAPLFALHPSASPTTTTAASAAVFANVNVFCTSFPICSPRVFVHVSHALHPIATTCSIDKLMA